MELAFFTRPVAGLITPGMPMPTVAVTPSWVSASRTRRRWRPASRGSRAGVGMRWRSTSAPSGPRTAISILVPPRSMPIRCWVMGPPEIAASVQGEALYQYAHGCRHRRLEQVDQLLAGLVPVGWPLRSPPRRWRL